MAHWRKARRGESGVPFGVWWAMAEALAAPFLMLSLTLFGLV